MQDVRFDMILNNTNCAYNILVVRRANFYVLFTREKKKKKKKKKSATWQDWRVGYGNNYHWV